MLAIGEAVADAFPGCRSRNDSCYWNRQAQQNAEHQEDQFDDTEDAIHVELYRNRLIHFPGRTSHPRFFHGL